MPTMQKVIAHLERLRVAKDAHIVHGAGLDPYQRVAVQFLVDAERALLADIPGAGKTAVTVRAAMEAGAKRVLIITKKSLLYHWQQEVDKWCGDACSQYTTKSKAVPVSRFVVTNYEAAVRCLDKLLSEHWDAVVADEATAIKGRKTQRAKAVHTLCWSAKYAWLLTGTPIHNRPDELWSLLRALDKKTFSSYWRFVDEYCEVDFTMWGRKILGPRNLQQLHRVLVPYVLRRDEAALGLRFPDLLEETIALEMTPRQKKLYTDMRKEFRANPALAVLAGDFVWAPNVVAQLVRLRQIACSPVLIGDTDEGCKTPAICELLEEHANYSKVLVFTSFAEYAKVLASELSAYSPVVITGDVSDRERKNAVDRFTGDTKCRLLIGTTRAMGEGLNLQVADIIVFADMDWSPAAMEQAIARSRRRGRTKPVRVVKLVASGTVDEHIAEVLERKDAMIREVDAVGLIAKREIERGGI